ncbi:MAG: LytTR family DNA-binding domain-containing protein [Clostridiales bacterium]|nr:LytTR family DNA-binding domain-containing protein [Clostridiales bacterium]
MIRAAVVEDDEKYREQIHGFLKRYGESRNILMEITEYGDGAAIVKNYSPCQDVIFLDVEMPGMDGMKAAHRIREKDAQVVIVFVTGVARYAVKGYEVGALDFILKPLKYESFAQKMDRIVRTADRSSEKNIVISSGNDVYRIPVSHLVYVEVIRHQVIYHTEDQEIRVRSSLKEAEKLLLENGFEKCNSCYLVNLRHVRGIQDNSVLVGKERLQISRAKKKAFIQAATAYIGGQ